MYKTLEYYAQLAENATHIVNTILKEDPNPTKEYYAQKVAPDIYGHGYGYFPEGMTLNDLYALCKIEVEAGNGDMIVKISDNPASSNYHLLKQGFSDGESELQTRDLPGIEPNDLLLG